MMKEWLPKLKYYPHFDKPLSEEKVIRIVTNPAKVAANAFFPFILYEKETERFGRVNKKRPIRYAARRDAYIFAYYRQILSALYEKKLLEFGIQDCPIAYRKISVQPNSTKGKCNIHFAKEAFEKITEMGACYAIAMDISSYFESLDHSKLEKLWCELLGVVELPSDHKAVYRAIANYTVVDLNKCYERLGYIGDVEINGIKKKGFTLNPKAIPTQLCSPEDFRNKICGKDKKYEQLTIQNKEAWGIPQGSPISDLLANFYLMYFDKEIMEFATANGAYYRRYSDDILFICPPSKALLANAIDKIKNCVQQAGERLIIKDTKTNIVHFNKNDGKITATTIEPAGKQKPFEYLGFAFDGITIKLRDSTISKYYRKITFGVLKEAAQLVKRYPGKSVQEIFALADVSALYQKYGKIEEFDDSSDYEEWNFWTYAIRAAEAMAPLNNIILPQLRNHKKKILTLLEQEIPKEFDKHQKRLAERVAANKK